MMGSEQRKLPLRPHFFGTQMHIGDMSTPGVTPAQRVMHTSDAFFRKAIKLYLWFSIVLTVYTVVWEPASMAVSLIGIVSSLLAHVSLARGKHTLARWAFLLPFFLTALIQPWLVNGIRTPLLVHCVLLLVITGWMLGTRVMWMYVAAMSVQLLALHQAEASGWWQPPLPLRDGSIWWTSFQFSLLMTATMLSELLKNYRVDMQRENTWHLRLRSALEFNTLIQESSPVPIRVFGPEGQCMAVNRAYCELMGRKREPLLAQKLQDRSMQSAPLTAECLQALRTGMPYELEAHIQRSDGQDLWLHVHMVPFERDGLPHLLVHYMDMTERHRVTQELKQMAYHDSLTGLANRRLFREHFAHTQRLCARTQDWAAVLLLDMNNFKQLNDLHGHDAGDQMLQAVAQRLQDTVRASDVIARFGGDEFTLLVQGLGHNAAQASYNLHALTTKLYQALSQPYVLGAITHHSSASIGVALMDPSQPLDLDVLLHQADMQMYAHKRHQTQSNASDTAQLTN